MAVTLGFTSSTTMRMIRSVHRQTTHSRPYAEPSTPPSLTQHFLVVITVARNTNRSAGVLVESSDLSALQSDMNIFLCAFGALLLAAHDLRKSTGRAA